MTNEMTKVLLMFLIIGGFQAAIHIPKIWASQQWAFLARAMVHVRSAIVLTDRRVAAGSHKAEITQTSAFALKEYLHRTWRSRRWWPPERANSFLWVGRREVTP